MSAPIKIDGQLTSLQLFVGVLTMFRPPEGNLACQLVGVLAHDYHEASAILAMRHPEWDLQALTNLCEFTWFEEITLDPEGPDADALRQFIITDIEPAPDDRFRKH